MKIVLYLSYLLTILFNVNTAIAKDSPFILDSIVSECEGTLADQRLDLIKRMSHLDNIKPLTMKPSMSDNEVLSYIEENTILEQAAVLFRKSLSEIDKQDKSAIFNLKHDGSLVSTIEKEVEQDVGNFLKRIMPIASFQGEEGKQYVADNDLGYKWYLDPIDGTISFKNNLDTFGMTLTLTKGNVPIATIIDFPRLKKTYIAYKNRGAFRNGKKITISDKAFTQHSIIAHSDRYAFTLAGRLNFLESIAKLSYITRTYTDIYAYTLVAEGKCVAKVDIAGALWDLFPGLLLITEAGGHIKFYPANKPTPDLYGSMVVGHKKMVEEINTHFVTEGVISIKEVFNNRIPNIEEIRL